MELGDRNTMMTEASSQPPKSFDFAERGENEEIIYELHLDRWILAKQKISGLGNAGKKIRDMGGRVL